MLQLSTNMQIIKAMPKMTLVVLSLGVLQVLAGEFVSGPPSQIPHPTCQKKCGEITIPYPFGIGDDCHYGDHNYNLRCNYTTNNPPALIHGENMIVENITIDGEIWLKERVAYVCYNSSDEAFARNKHSSHMNRFTISTTKNSLVAVGCDTYVWFDGNGTTNELSEFHSGCMTVCNSAQRNILSDTCFGVGCCYSVIPDGVTNISVTAHSFNQHKLVRDFNPCSIAFVAAKEAMTFNISTLVYKNASDLQDLMFPVVYNWSVGNKTCETLAPGESICSKNSVCVDQQKGIGYNCKCQNGFQGNPYLEDCKDVDECKEGKHECAQPAYCENTVGSYKCLCPRGYTRRHGANEDDKNLCIRETRSITSKIALCVASTIVVCVIAAFCFYWQHQRRQLIKMRKSFFCQNGGDILLSKLQRPGASMGNMVKMFTVEEIKKATDNYNENYIIGRGGFGMVYKGILDNNQIIAIKKSLKVNSSQIEQFINEVIALSHVTHKNVVKLLGCCLETEVPLLVYEYIRNGTLHDHLHDESKSRFLTWEIRLRIAAEVSGVLTYLHTMITIPIIHRDIKSMNILLNENYVAKVSDFGASKLVPSNEDQLATMVQGTCGYLDPEYLQTGELTEKSDVYSFGVVLVELITREKALSYAKPEDEKCLAKYFLRKLKEDRLFEIVDDILVSDNVVEQIKVVANVARRCLKVKGEDRPTMKQVARELEDVMRMSSHPWSNNGGVVFQEESEYLLSETNNEYNNVKDDTLIGQSSIVQLVPMKDAGR